MTNPHTNIPSDYKPSPLGIIPEEWEVKRLGECTNLLTNGFVGVATPHYTEDSDGITYIQGYNVTEGGFNLRGIKKVTKEFHKKNSKSSLLEGDLLTIQTGDIGLTTIVPKDLEGSNCHALIISRFNNSIIPRFMLYYYNSSIGRERFRKIETGTTMKHINTGDLINFLVPVPSIEEQKAIVDLLKLWDTAIAKQTALIEQLTLRKRGLMQQLLTGKKRLKGFEGEWKELRLGEIGMFLSNNTLSRDQLNTEKGEVQNVHYGDVLIKYPSILDCSKTVLPFINESAYKDSMTDYVKDGDIIISDTAEDETVGKACEIQKLGNKKVLAGLHTMLLRPKDGVFAPFFLGYYFNSEKYHSKLLPLIQGIKVCSIGKQAIQNTIIEVPSIKEQTAIASVLVNADKEIEIQKQKLAAMQEEKKGLMQVLLTGKKRINK
jgi:type I restriction enzyme S subunit